MKSRLEKIIQDLDECIKEDIKVSSQIFGLAATSIEKNKDLLQQLSQPSENLPEIDSKLLLNTSHPTTQKDLQQRYGSYKSAYQYYHDHYGITCKTGWKNLLKAIKDLSSQDKKATLEERVITLESQVKQLEQTVNLLVNLIRSSY